MGELARAGRADGTRDSYSRYLNKLIDQLERRKPDPTVREVTVNDCRAFLDGWIGRSPSTIATIHSALNGLFEWLYQEHEIDENPMNRIQRPRRQRPEDVEVVTVTRAEVERMLAGTRGWQEFLCLSVLAYTGVRRATASRLRWKDVDLDAGTVLFHEKGHKVSEKPIPHDLWAILRAAAESDEVSSRPLGHRRARRRARRRRLNRARSAPRVPRRVPGESSRRARIAAGADEPLAH